MPVGAPNCNSPIFRDLREYYHERCAPMRERTECASEHKELSCSAGVAGKYACTRCGWRWTPRANSPDPPHACARCRSAYWQSTPVSCRANSPSGPKWRAESQSVARRKQVRHLARLRELAAEFGFALSPIRDDLTFAPPVFPQPQGPSQPVEPVPSRENSVPAPRRSLVEELRRRMAAAAPK
jgi:hypothetical protein